MKQRFHANVFEIEFLELQGMVYIVKMDLQSLTGIFSSIYESTIILASNDAIVCINWKDTIEV